MQSIYRNYCTLFSLFHFVFSVPIEWGFRWANLCHHANAVIGKKIEWEENSIENDLFIDSHSGTQSLISPLRVTSVCGLDASRRGWIECEECLLLTLTTALHIHDVLLQVWVCKKRRKKKFSFTFFSLQVNLVVSLKDCSQGEAENDVGSFTYYCCWLHSECTHTPTEQSAEH